jgi:hypothetical protein
MSDHIINEVERKTAQHVFFPCNPDGDRLFSVREGILVEEAVNSASAILGAAHETIKRIADKHDDEELWGASYLIEMATAVMEAASRGIVRGE